MAACSGAQQLGAGRVAAAGRAAVLVRHADSQIWLIPNRRRSARTACRWSIWRLDRRSSSLLAASISRWVRCCCSAMCIAARFMEDQPLAVVLLIALAGDRWPRHPQRPHRLHDQRLRRARHCGDAGHELHLVGAGVVDSCHRRAVAPRRTFAGYSPAPQSGIGGAYIVPILMIVDPRHFGLYFVAPQPHWAVDVCDWQQQRRRPAGRSRHPAGEDCLLCDWRGDGRAGRAWPPLPSPAPAIRVLVSVPMPR